MLAQLILGGDITFLTMPLKSDPTVFVLVSSDRKYTIDLWDKYNPVVTVYSNTNWNVLQQFKKESTADGFYLISLWNQKPLSSFPDGIIGFGGSPLLFTSTTMPRKYMTYNVAHGVMTYEKGWEADIVEPCISAHGIKKIGGLTPCARLGVELVASQGPEVIGIQEFSSLRNGKNWVNYLRKVSGRDYQLHMASQENHLMSAIVYEHGNFEALYPKNPRNAPRCVALFDKVNKLIIASIHVSHSVAQVNIREFVEDIWDFENGMIHPDHIILMGDFNDTYLKGCTSMNLWGKKLTLRNPGMRTCCADRENAHNKYPLNYPYFGDFFYSTDSMEGKATLVKDNKLRTSDHRAVVYDL
jgi:endonuclease/exonuclease/phosphatase family metal-dependent hydrolase